jgi:hypothetical protein
MKRQASKLTEPLFEGSQSSSFTEDLSNAAQRHIRLLADACQRSTLISEYAGPALAAHATGSCGHMKESIWRLPTCNVAVLYSMTHALNRCGIRM